MKKGRFGGGGNSACGAFSICIQLCHALIKVVDDTRIKAIEEAGTEANANVHLGCIELAGHTVKGVRKSSDVIAAGHPKCARIMWHWLQTLVYTTCVVTAEKCRDAALRHLKEEVQRETSPVPLTEEARQVIGGRDARTLAVHIRGKRARVRCAELKQSSLRVQLAVRQIASALRLRKWLKRIVRACIRPPLWRDAVHYTHTACA